MTEVNLTEATSELCDELEHFLVWVRKNYSAEQLKQAHSQLTEKLSQLSQT